MSSDEDSSERECPNCALSLGVTELLAHLQWDHNYTEYKAREKLGLEGSLQG